jgi:hypothetical protein
VSSSGDLDEAIFKSHDVNLSDRGTSTIEPQAGMQIGSKVATELD